MKARYVLAPEAATDLVQIWEYIKNRSSTDAANRVEAVIREKIAFLSRAPSAGHWRKDLTNEAVRFFPAYSYLIVYRPDTKPLHVVSILHGHRDTERILKGRL